MTNKFIFLISLCLFLMCGVLSAKTYNGFPINKITIESSNLTLARNMKLYLTEKLSGFYSDPIINDFIKTVYNNHRLENITVSVKEEYDGLHLIVKLYDKFFISDIIIIGNETFNEIEINNIIKINKYEETINIDIDKIRNNVLDFYRGKGFFDAFVSVDVVKIPNLQGLPLKINISEGSRVSIDNIRFFGFGNVNLSTLINRFGVKLGQFYDKDSINAGIERISRYLYKKKYLEASISRPIVRFDKDNFTCQITISCNLGKKIKIDFSGNRHFWDKELVKELKINEIKSFTQESSKSLEISLLGLYKNNGFLNVQIETKFEETSDSASIKFKITEGNLIRISGFKITGAESIKSARLKKLINIGIRATGFKRVLSSDVLKTTTESISIEYKNNGFLNVEAEVTEKSFIDNNSVVLQISIIEGPQTIIKDIKILGNNVFLTDGLLSALTIKNGDPLNYLKVSESKRLILQNYYRDGFIDCEVVESIFVANNKTDATIEFAIFEKEQALVGNIAIKGNFRTRDSIIRQEVSLEYGMPLNAEEIFETQKNIQNLGIFKSVSIKDKGTIPGSNYHEIEIEVSEANSIVLEFGAGYGSFTEGNEYFKDHVARGFAEISHNNLFGRRERASIKTEISRRVPTAAFLERKVMFSFLKPNTLNLHLDTSFNYLHKKEDRIAFDVHENSFTLNLDKEIITNVRGTLQYIFEFIDTFNAVDATENGLLRLGAIGFIYNVAGTNKKYNPTAGILSTAKLHIFNEYIASEADFAKIILRNEIFFPLFKYLTWHLSIRGGYGFSYGRTNLIPIEERFFLGGTFSVRGFSEDSVGSDATFTDTGDPLGGNIFINYTAELILPIYKNFKGAVFTDGGNVYANNSDFDFLNQRNSAGFGIRYETPIGPLKLDYGMKLDKKSNERLWNIHFAIGVF